MKCSVAPNELAFVVYTNSRGDYGVTARSPGATMPCTERMLDEVAHRCGPYLSNEFSALVAVLPSPDRAENYLALRVFDIGEFLARPHTLAIVAVEIPREHRRTWNITQLMASLAVPVPNDSSYSLPAEEKIAQSSVSDEPFKSLNDWEAERDDRRPGSAVVFSKPPNIELQLERLLELSTPRSQNRSSMRWTTATIAVALFVGLLGWLFWMNRRPPTPPPPTSRHTREELLRVLSDLRRRPSARCHV